MVRWPGRIEVGAVSKHLGYFPDALPTLNELAGGGATAPGDGISIVPELLGEEASGRKQEQHSYLYWEDGKATAVRMGDWKAVQPSPKAPFELHDLSVDIQEQRNVAEEHQDVLVKMMRLAKQAHSAPRRGRVLDPKIGFRVKTH